MIKKFEDLNDLQIDVLREIGNIGSGNAASALSSMINKSIEIEMPSVKILDFQESIENNGNPEDLVGAVLIRLKGEVEGMVLLIVEPQFAETVLAAFFGATPENSNLLEFGDDRRSALIEIGNIMGSSYVSAICDLSGLSISIETPSYTADMLGAVMSVPVIEFGEVGDKLLCIDKKIKIDGAVVKSNMLLIPTVESLSTLFNRLGVGS